MDPKTGKPFEFECRCCLRPYKYNKKVFLFSEPYLPGKTFQDLFERCTGLKVKKILLS